MDEWNKFKKNNPKAKMICIDIAPYTTVQMDTKRNDILLVGGFSDHVFEVINDFISR